MLHVKQYKPWNIQDCHLNYLDMKSKKQYKIQFNSLIQNDDVLVKSFYMINFIMFLNKLPKPLPI